ncbi:hypothetical protein F0562_034154 [Nyssa sinensis]|uniref:Uncharacterized protein n=1 Tax=Nyssa sinensis TaxID=561372 RepID=A0A5J5AJ70_9ASTE|nr:hypothetical protein F0562_034154 [Nyssa sinensis]
MASNLPLNANIIDCPPSKDDPHSLQAHVSLSKVHGEDGAVMEAQGIAEFIFSPIILNANISTVHGHHDLSALLQESRLGVILVKELMVLQGMELQSMIRIQPIHGLTVWKKGNLFLKRPWILRLSLGVFLEDPSFLMESLDGDLSYPSIRGRRTLNNGSHGGCGGRGRGARVVRGIQDQKPSFNSFDKATFPNLRSAYVSHSKGLLAHSKGGMQEYGRSNTRGFSQVSSVVLTIPPANHAPQDVHAVAVAEIGNHDKEASNASHVQEGSQTHHVAMQGRKRQQDQSPVLSWADGVE